MRMKYLVLAALVLAATACSPLAPAATPTAAPLQLADAAMQQAAVAAVSDYATRMGYAYRNVSLSLLDNQATQVVVHATVAFETRKGFGFEDHDTLFFMHKTSAGWQADTIQSFSKLDWEVALQRGPSTLKSGAGFSIDVPAGWAAYVAPESELIAANVCGIGVEPLKAVPVLLAVPVGFSAENTPIALRGFQQCPRAASVNVIRQRLEALRASDKTLRFEQLDFTQLAGRSVLTAVVVDENNTVLYDYFLLHRDRQLEFAIQARAGQDARPILAVLSTMVFN
jgi:hypothetical protein